MKYGTTIETTNYLCIVHILVLYSLLSFSVYIQDITYRVFGNDELAIKDNWEDVVCLHNVFKIIC